MKKSPLTLTLSIVILKIRYLYLNVMPKMYILFPKIKEEKVLTQGPLEKLEIIRKEMHLHKTVT